MTVNDLYQVSIITGSMMKFDRPISLSVLSSRDSVQQTIHEGDRGAAVIVNSLSTAIIPLLPEKPQNQDASVSNEVDWEIVRIVDTK